MQRLVRLRLLLLLNSALLLLLLRLLLLLELCSLNRRLPIDYTHTLLLHLRAVILIDNPLLCRVINKDVLDPRDFLPQQLVFLGQVIVLHLLKLYPLLIDVPLPLYLIFMQALLLIPGPLHLRLDLLKLSLHLIAAALVLLSQPCILLLCRMSLLFGAL